MKGDFKVRTKFERTGFLRNILAKAFSTAQSRLPVIIKD